MTVQPIGVGNNTNYTMESSLVNRNKKTWQQKNDTIIKPSEKAHSVQYLVSKILAKAGLPMGAVQVLLGDGETAQGIVNDERISKIGFTGGTKTAEF